MSMKKILIVIPARFGSTRLEGKPLKLIAGKSMVQRVYEIAQCAANDFDNAETVIATDDDRIIEHAQSFGAKAVMTGECETGSDRTLDACRCLNHRPDYIINLQGDSPLTPVHFITQLIAAFLSDPTIDVVTPVMQLTWDELKKLKQHKSHNPFSGTTAIIDKSGYAVWFSKQIVPAIRHYERLKTNSKFSPVYKHIGLYGYTFAALNKFVDLQPSHYETLEGLEQLRMLENGMRIKTVSIQNEQYPTIPGVDTLDDLSLVEDLLLHYGEPELA